MKKITHVAVAILQKQVLHGKTSKYRSCEYLLASRPQGKPWAGWWEFPGGKIEANETPENALKRELKEELDIAASRIQPWLQRVYDYPKTHDSPAKNVHLHFFSSPNGKANCTHTKASNSVGKTRKTLPSRQFFLLMRLSCKHWLCRPFMRFLMRPRWAKTRFYWP